MYTQNTTQSWKNDISWSRENLEWIHDFNLEIFIEYIETKKRKMSTILFFSIEPSNKILMY